MEAYDRPLSSNHLFPEYTRANYRAAFGTEAPEFDPAKPQKSWCDSAASLSSRRFVTYDDALDVGLNGITPILGPDGHPQLKPLTIPKAEAISVNIAPERGWQGETLPPTPVPCRPLATGEILVIAEGFGGAVLIRNVAQWEATQTELEQAGGFTPADRALVRRIAVKLGA